MSISASTPLPNRKTARSVLCDRSMSPAGDDGSTAPHTILNDLLAIASASVRTEPDACPKYSGGGIEPVAGLQPVGMIPILLGSRSSVGVGVGRDVLLGAGDGAAAEDSGESWGRGGSEHDAAILATRKERTGLPFFI